MQEFRKALENYESDVSGKGRGYESPDHCPMPIAVRKGDILQVMSADDQYMQVG